MNRIALACILSTLAGPVLADTVKVDGPWVRATAPGQKVAGGFMTLTADADMVLVGGASPVSKHVELHYMKMDNGVMEMREMKEIPLPKDKAVSLEPGGLHVMFIDLRAPIKPGQKVPLTLRVKGADGKEQKLEVEAEARRPGSH
ncbi:MAG TPA: copper chaperone PCu(A)C [Thiobacillaceae bacterium]|nr:copper chaperone PCu(A)C [Thiobacillaceae bacterium]HNA82715.1 copper chaperone PCu(A)C [Thiobacillaceae bacterium]HNF88804.1 copper chaperone PCu(A)C [Thiobacillaceae bacterium]HNH89024.1 copper chaperone PCu(A)C [Thiobacillaceae bacterium]